MTGYGQATDRASALQAGFDAHIVKPASADKIVRALYGRPDAEGAGLTPAADTQDV